MKLNLLDRTKSNTKATFLHDADKKPNKNDIPSYGNMWHASTKTNVTYIQIWTIPTLANTDFAVSTRISAHKTMICIAGANSIDANQWHIFTDSFDSLPRSFPFNATLIVLKIFGNYYPHVDSTLWNLNFTIFPELYASKSFQPSFSTWSVKSYMFAI